MATTLESRLKPFTLADYHVVDEIDTLRSDLLPGLEIPGGELFKDETAQKFRPPRLRFRITVA